jgi:tight adherence protein B
MKPALPGILAAASVLLVLLVASGIGLARASRRDARKQDRVEQATAPYAPRRPASAFARGRAATSLGLRRLAGQFARLCGFDPARADHYPLRWWIVFPLALLLGRMITALAYGFVGPAAWVATPAGFIVLSRRFYRWADARRVDRLYAQFPDALAMIVRSVRVGIPVVEAVRVVGREAPEPTAEEFRRLGDQVAIGTALEVALRDLAARNTLPEYRFFATALALQAQTGGALAETLDNLADVIRRRVAVRARAYALASEARTSSMILAALPVVTGGALAVINPTYVGQLIFDPMGRQVLAMAIASLGAGVLVMRGIIRKSLS